MSEALKAVREASKSIACLLDEPTEVTVKDLEHLQNQITVLENFLDPYIPPQKFIYGVQLEEIKT